LDCLSFAYLLIGIAIILIYLVLFFNLGCPAADESCSGTRDEHLLRLEYETLNEEVRRRGEMLAVHGSIFVVASLLLLGQSALTPQPTRAAILFVALFVYAAWMFAMTYSTGRLDNIAFARLRGIEKQLGFEVHRYMKEKTECKTWLKARRFIWGFVLIVLVAGGSFLLLIN